MTLIVVLAIIGVIVIIALIARSRPPKLSRDASMEMMKDLLIAASKQPLIPKDWGRDNPDYILAETFNEKGDYVKASLCYRKAAQEDSAVAQYELGVMYIEGRGVNQDYSEAAKWFRKAAEHGIPDAQANLGLHYARGIGVPKDSSEAVKWFRKAADQGFADGQFKLGAMYANGEGVPQDFKEAFRLISLAAAQGHAEAKVERELVARRAFFAGVSLD